jgi:hypothetical protein
VGSNAPPSKFLGRHQKVTQLKANLDKHRRPTSVITPKTQQQHHHFQEKEHLLIKYGSAKKASLKLHRRAIE